VSFAVLERSSGVVSGESDLWCTYAAVRALRWLDRLDPLRRGAHVAAVEGFLRSRRNSDGGYAWSAGMSSDAWATYYCTQALADLGVPAGAGGEPFDPGWVGRCANDDGGFGMTPGQASDVWATYYAVRVLVEICGLRPPEALHEWLAGLQGPDGGLCWSPAHAKDGESDVRACYYGVVAWATATGGDAAPPWDRDRLIAWLTARQSGSGGFRFQAGDDTDCLWATFRATGALARLGAGPADRDACVSFVRGQLVAGESFTRWPGYPVQDVWAAFCAAGSLVALGDDPSDVADQVARAIDGFRIDGGGFTYRRPDRASDVLSTSAALLTGGGSTAAEQRMRDWLSSCVLPNENGIMYMPGRGSEVRCTLWALAAGALAGDTEALARVSDWLGTAIQNPDGGFGYWEGRASDMVSTSAATDILARTGDDDPGRAARIAAFVATCRTPDGEYANVPGGTPTLRSTLQALRTLHRTAPTGDEAGAARAAMAAHRVRGGGFAAEGRRLPDLLSTYEAVLASDLLGIEVDVDHAARFLASVRIGADGDSGGYAWTPLVRVGGGPLAEALGSCLERRLGQAATPLPPLAIS
jgi:prenyltransferase beta subunit